MFLYHTLSNGVRIVYKHTDTGVTHSGVYIHVGSRDELQPEEEGIAHFIEHCIFKGTKRRKAFHILNRIDGVGGELNAFTTKEETCVYASTLTPHFERSIELFADILFCSTFPEKELERERDVVLEEIDSYKDLPSELIFDEFEELLYFGHPLSHNILGSKRNVRRFSSSALQRFVSDNYVPSRMVISVVGGVPFDKVIRVCERHFGSVSATQGGKLCRVRPEIKSFNQTVHRPTHQVHALAGCEAYSAFDERKVAFALLSNLLGGPAMNSRLNMAIRERCGYCYTIESQYTPLSDTGLFTVYAGIDAGAVDRYVRALMEELQKMVDTTLTPRQLLAAQRQLIGQMAVNNEQFLNEMQAMGKSLLLFDRVDTMEEMQADVLSVTVQEMQSVAADLFCEENFSFLFYV